MKDDQLKKFLIDSGLVSRKDLDLAREDSLSSKKSLAHAIIARGILSLDDIRKIEANITGVPFVSLRNHPIRFSVLSLIPEPVCRNHNLVAFQKNENDLEVAMLDLDDIKALEFLRQNTPLRVLPRLTDSDSIRFALLEYQKELKNEFSDVLKRNISPNDPLYGSRMVDTLLKHAIVQGASDVNIEPGEKELHIKYRIGGVLVDAMVLTKESVIPILNRIKSLAKIKLEQSDEPRHGEFKVEMSGERSEFRVSVLPSLSGEKINIKLCRLGHTGMTLENQGFYGEPLEKIHDALKTPKGMIIVSGPVSSGRSTILYSMIDIINSPHFSIATVEESVERVIPRVSQTVIRPDIGLNFSGALRSVLGHDPDVVMIEEIREEETASLALRALENGKMIISAMDTRSSAGVITKLLGMGLDPLSLASNLSVVVGSRLVRGIKNKGVMKPLNKQELSVLGKAVDLDRMLTILRNNKIIGEKDGFEKVRFSLSEEYKGNVGIHEVLKVTPGIKELILKGAKSSEIEARAKKEGMTTLLEDGILASAKGLTTLDEVLRAVLG